MVNSGGWDAGKGRVLIIRLTGVDQRGRLLPGPEVGQTTGWIDMNDGVQSTRRADGTYVVCAEEVWMPKGLYWLWKP